MSTLTIEPLDLAGLTVVRRNMFRDGRGAFGRIFCSAELGQDLFPEGAAQVNHSITLGRGTVRGMHFQRPPFAEAKLVTCVRGEVFDVAVDLRQGSATFLQWRGLLLREEEDASFLIPPGFAHGFQCLSDEAQLVYCHSLPYSSNHEGGVSPLDPKIAISWPLPAQNMSVRDQSHLMISNTHDPAIHGIPT
jgi:dTDP-4-dehydrorhamnose 3,5-epimerase